MHFTWLEFTWEVTWEPPDSSPESSPESSLIISFENPEEFIGHLFILVHFAHGNNSCFEGVFRLFDQTD